MAESLGRPELVAEIRARIESSGPLTFAESMELALYHSSCGWEAAEYYAPERRYGTLLCYYRHVDEEPLVRVGLQDVTAHVEFTSLMRHGEDVGLETIELTAQRAFLVGLGIPDVAARLGSGLCPARRLEADLALAELIRTGGLGDFRVLVQRKR